MNCSKCNEKMIQGQRMNSAFNGVEYYYWKCNKCGKRFSEDLLREIKIDAEGEAPSI